MENQHQLITGYRELTQEEIDLMNEVKAMGEQVGILVNKLYSHGQTDKIWVDSANMELKKGFMALTRSIAKPTSF